MGARSAKKVEEGVRSDFVIDMDTDHIYVP